MPDIIHMPHDSRPRICCSLPMLGGKKREKPWKKLGKIPL
jgi:hypothetical protein